MSVGDADFERKAAQALAKKMASVKTVKLDRDPTIVGLDLQLRHLLAVWGHLCDTGRSLDVDAAQVREWSRAPLIARPGFLWNETRTSCTHV